jgi:hypothetical protein
VDDDDDPTGYYERKRQHRAPVAGCAVGLTIIAFGAFAAWQLLQSLWRWLH